MGISVDPNVYVDGTERRTLDLRPDGISCIPVLGMSNFQSVRTGTDEHIHPDCVEISLCLRGNLMFESFGMEYPFLPGTVFVSQQDEPHRMRNNPKGLMLCRILFQIPRNGEAVLDLPQAESRWIVNALTHFPMRLFPATERVKTAFARLFAIYDTEGRRTVSRRLKMKAAVLELLLSLIEAPLAVAVKKGKCNPKVNAVVERMRSAPVGDYSIEALAREVGLSTVAFFEAFKRATGLPPHAFLLDVRIRAAARDLEDVSVSVADIAKRYRFSSPQHFATAFRRIMGVSPRRH
ncbi:MAG: AraC family transcriptional regulator [Kiritimatiellae bacterium]|nr:AraC family transcriptional regulator [Kiritimatiellia bacterium]MBR6588844.1 AraC family transcriptional regulator [Kiritimatiellia bacterium]